MYHVPLFTGIQKFSSAEARIVLLQDDPDVGGVSGFICRRLDCQGKNHSHSVLEEHGKTSGPTGRSDRALDWQEWEVTPPGRGVAGAK
jgi:hypothetical protein